MSPGRELDALIAEKIFGYHIQKTNGDVFYFTYIKDTKKGELAEAIRTILPHYSTDIAAAITILDKYNVYHIKKEGAVYIVWLPGKPLAGESAHGLAHAICLAALRTISEQS